MGEGIAGCGTHTPTRHPPWPKSPRGKVEEERWCSRRIESQSEGQKEGGTTKLKRWKWGEVRQTDGVRKAFARQRDEGKGGPGKDRQTDWSQGGAE